MNNFLKRKTRFNCYSVLEDYVGTRKTNMNHFTVYFKFMSTSLLYYTLKIFVFILIILITKNKI